MSDEKKETYADISAELRDLSRSEKLSIGAKYCEPQPMVGGKPIGIYFAELADRIEAAIERDRTSRRSIKIPIEVVPTCSVAAHAMTLDEAIAHAEDVADRCDTSCGKEHRQLADWLKELRDMKSQPVGNAAAMRETLVAVKKSIDGMGISSLDCDPTILMAALTQVCARLSARIERALSAPARNCDLYSDAREALKAHEEAFNESNFHHGECKLGCPDCDDYAIRCEIKWLLAPAAERKGEGDGK